MRTFRGHRRGCAGKRLAVVALPALIAAAGAVVMLLWNWLMPTVFTGVHTVSYWQALGLLVLSRLLLGGLFRGRPHPHWGHMSEQEREQLRSHFKRRWGDHWGGPFSEGDAEDAPSRPSRPARPSPADAPARGADKPDAQA